MISKQKRGSEIKYMKVMMLMLKIWKVFTISFTPFSFTVSGNYTEWSEWSACNKTCDGGQQKRERNCTNPSPANGGLKCTEQGLGAAQEILSCNENPCPSRETLRIYFLSELFSNGLSRPELLNSRLLLLENSYIGERDFCSHHIALKSVAFTFKVRKRPNNCSPL